MSDAPSDDGTYVEVRGPYGGERRVGLAGRDLTVGRLVDDSEIDVALDDPHSLISRLHCVLDNEYGTWWVTDNASRNGTFVRRDDDTSRVTGRTRLDDGDVVLIAGAIEDGAPKFWELEIRDPNTTVQISAELAAADPADDHVRWDADARRLEVVVGGQASVVELRRQGYLFVDHLARRNAENGAAVVVSPDELLEAVWGQRQDWDPYRPPTVENLRDIVSAVRRAIEPDPAEPRLLENLRGIGYRLQTSV